MKYLNRILKITCICSITLVVSCTTGEDELFDESMPSTFGIRHDLDLTIYENIATNSSAFSGSEYPDFSSVVAFSYSLDGSDNHEYVATGTLVRSNWILTAGHNFFDKSSQNSPPPVTGIEVLIGNDPNSPTEIISVEEIVYHPSWLEDAQEYYNADDLCLVKLESSVSDITPAEINFETSEVIGSTVWYSGYGDYSQSEGQDPDLFSKKHSIENVLDRKVSGLTSNSNIEMFSGGLLAFDFDSPVGNINALGDDFVEEDEELLGNGTSDAAPTDYEGTTVEGDSGGPLFVKIDGTWKVGGVLSGGAFEPLPNHRDSDYGDISIFIRTATAKDWIQFVLD